MADVNDGGDKELKDYCVAIKNLHTFETKDLEQKYVRRKSRYGRRNRNTYGSAERVDSLASHEGSLDSELSPHQSIDEGPDAVLDIEGHVLPFPNRNPLLNVREAKKLGNEDVKPELGFGFIKKDELQKN